MTLVYTSQSTVSKSLDAKTAHGKFSFPDMSCRISIKGWIVTIRARGVVQQSGNAAEPELRPFELSQENERPLARKQLRRRQAATRKGRRNKRAATPHMRLRLRRAQRERTYRFASKLAIVKCLFSLRTVFENVFSGVGRSLIPMAARRLNFLLSRKAANHKACGSKRASGTPPKSRKDEAAITSANTIGGSCKCPTLSVMPFVRSRSRPRALKLSHEPKNCMTATGWNTPIR
jgi:hypothetical protein